MFLILKCCLSYVKTCRIVPATKPSLTFLLGCHRHDGSGREVWKTVNMETRRDPAGSPGCRVCRKRKMEPIFIDEEWYCCGYKTAGQHHHNNETLKQNSSDRIHITLYSLQLSILLYFLHHFYFLIYSDFALLLRIVCYHHTHNKSHWG